MIKLASDFNYNDIDIFEVILLFAVAVSPVFISIVGLAIEFKSNQTIIEWYVFKLNDISP